MSTRAVLSGCCNKVRQKFVDRLENSHFPAYHPLLLPKTFAEYERQRHFDLVWPLTQKLVCRVEALDVADNQAAQPGDPSEAGDEPEAYAQQWLQISWLRNGLQNWKQELDKMIAHSHALRGMKLYCPDSGKGASESTETTPINASFADDVFHVDTHAYRNSDEYRKLEDAGRRIHHRLLELRGEYDEHIRACATVIEGMALSSSIGVEQGRPRRRVDQPEDNSVERRYSGSDSTRRRES